MLFIPNHLFIFIPIHSSLRCVMVVFEIGTSYKMVTIQVFIVTTEQPHDQTVTTQWKYVLHEHLHHISLLHYYYKKDRFCKRKGARVIRISRSSKVYLLLHIHSVN